jgi:hypothetical protein
MLPDRRFHRRRLGHQPGALCRTGGAGGTVCHRHRGPERHIKGYETNALPSVGSRHDFLAYTAGSSATVSAEILPMVKATTTAGVAIDTQYVYPVVNGLLTGGHRRVHPVDIHPGPGVRGGAVMSPQELAATTPNWITESKPWSLAHLCHIADRRPAGLARRSGHPGDGPGA